jgi:PKD repeat protein/predicted dienelactone hydrolase
MAVFIVSPIPALSTVQAKASAHPGLPGPYEVVSMTVTTSNPDTNSDLETDLYYPSGDGDTVDPDRAPYPALVFAQATLSSPSNYSGWGDHLASWGYIVAIPDLPSEDEEVRASDVQHLVTYLEAENATSTSPFFHEIDVDRFGLIGHSLGGRSTMMVAGRDGRIKAAVALDPAGNPLAGWDYETEAPRITAPLAVIGAPSQLCNAYAVYNNVYPVVGSTHKAKYVIAGGSHCDFIDTDEQLQILGCSLICGQFSEDRMELAERYTTAWFNYYLGYDTDYYTYLYGDEADADIGAGRISREVHNAPRDVTAVGGFSGVDLGWTLHDHPMVAGYNIYRSVLSSDYLGPPHVRVGREAAYKDTDVVLGERYYYVVRSRDAARNEHESSREVSAVAACTSLAAGFEADPVDCCAPLTVVFTNTSIVDASVVPTNTIESWHWHFGDGLGSSTDENPIYAYEELGTYTVTLTVTDSTGCSDTGVMPNYIEANPPPTARFEVSSSVGQLPLEVKLTDTSIADTSVLPTNGIERWYWDFGDGVGSSNERNPRYTYEQPGRYTVVLRVTDSHGCTDDAAGAVEVVEGFNCLPYLPLIMRDEPIDDRGAHSRIQWAPWIRAVLDRALDLLRRLSAWPLGF